MGFLIGWFGGLGKKSQITPRTVCFGCRTESANLKSAKFKNTAFWLNLTQFNACQIFPLYGNGELDCTMMCVKGHTPDFFTVHLHVHIVSYAQTSDSDDCPSQTSDSTSVRAILGLSLCQSICFQRQSSTRYNNYIYSSGQDTVNEPKSLSSLAN